MARHQGPVLVDTNVIIECWRTASWKALAGGYRIETVQMCEAEAQTGALNRAPKDRIDPQVLKDTLKAVREHIKAAMSNVAKRHRLPHHRGGRRTVLHPHAHLALRPLAKKLGVGTALVLTVAERIGIPRHPVKKGVYHSFSPEQAAKIEKVISELIWPREAAALFGISYNALWELTAAGSLVPYIYAGTGNARYLRCDIIELLESVRARAVSVGGLSSERPHNHLGLFEYCARTRTKRADAITAILNNQLTMVGWNPEKTGLQACVLPG